MSIKRLGWPVTSAIAVAGMVLFALFLNELGNAWSAAIQGTATVVLVIVTSTYAYSTFKLVEAQELGPTRSAQITAISKVMTTAHRKGALPGQIAAHLEKDLENMSPDIANHLDDLIKDTEELRDALIEQVILLPEPLFEECWDTIWQVWHACDAGDAVLKAISKEGEASIHEGREFDPGRVRALYYDEFRDNIEDKPEWDQLIDRSYFDHVSTHLRILVDRCRQYVVQSRTK